jgi:hypothetical protein
MEEKILSFETPIKPEITNLKEIVINTAEFNEQDKAEALIKSLNLKVSDKIREDSDEEFTINPRYVLKGDSPEHYKKEVEEVKKILTDKEKKAISLYFRRKNEDQKIRDKIYYPITKRIEKLYTWNDEKKEHTPKIQSERCKQICKSLDYISNCNLMSGFNNLIYWLLSKEDRDFTFCYKCAWFNKPIPNIQEWREENDGEYLVLTESEADYRAKEYLTDDPYLWEQQVESHNTTESLEDWADWVISCDGRGSVLNGYDGSEETEEINGTTYCIYRTN